MRVTRCRSDYRLEPWNRIRRDLTTGSACTSGQFYGSGFDATTTGASFSGPLVFSKASIIMIKGWLPDARLGIQIRHGHPSAWWWWTGGWFRNVVLGCRKHPQKREIRYPLCRRKTAVENAIADYCIQLFLTRIVSDISIVCNINKSIRKLRR